MAGSSCLTPFIGIGICAITGFFGCLTSVLVKHLSHVDSFLIVTVRFCIMVLISTPVSALRSNSESVFPSGKRKLIFLRAILGTLVLMTNYFSLQHLPLADATMIGASSPMFTAIFARLFIKEPISPADALNVVLVFSGIVLIAKPPFIFGESDLYSNDPNAVYAVLGMILSSTLLQSNVYVIVRSLKELHWSKLVSVLGIVGFISSLSVIVAFGKTCLPESSLDRLLMVFAGLASFLNQFGMVIASKFETAATGALLRKSFMVLYAFLFQILFFKTMPGLLSSIGAMLIFIAVLVSSMKKVLQNHPFKSINCLQCLYSTSKK